VTSLSSKLVIKVSPKSDRTYVPCKGKYKNGVIDDYLQDSYNFFKVRTNGFVMPKSGGIKNDDCGRWGVKGCFNVGSHPDGMEYGKRFKMSCDDPLCPECADTWLFKESRRASDKLNAYAKRFKLPVKHLVWSPDPTYFKFKEMGIKEMRKVCRNDLKEAGCVGGNMILHPFRYRMVDDKKMWYVSPHFHVIGFGWIVTTKELHAKSHAIIKNLGKRDSVKNTMSYLLSHAGVKKGVQTVVWFGTMSNGKMDWYEIPKTTDICPHCEQKLVVAEFTEVFEPPPPEWDDGLLSVGSLFVPKKPRVYRGN